MKLNVAIIDDESAIRRSIAVALGEWAEKAGLQADVSEYSSAEAFLFAYEEKKDIDILLLDIEMDGMNGVELAKRIRREDKLCQIIFITGYSDYIADGYDVAALHYLLKPLSREKFFTVLDRATQKLRENERTLTLAVADGTVRIPLHEILYIDVLGNYVTVHGKEDYAAKKTLGEVEKLLDERFFRCGRGLIVNLLYVSRVTKEKIRLSNGTELSYPRSAYEGLNRAIISRI